MPQKEITPEKIKLVLNLHPAKPRTDLDVVRANNDLLTFLLHSFQVQADKFNKGCTIKLRYSYNEDLKVAKLEEVVAEGEHQIPSIGMLMLGDEEKELRNEEDNS